MPLYTFTCSNGHSHDALAGRDAPSSRPCPQCAGPAERQSTYRFGVAGFVPPPISERSVNIKPFMEASEEIAYRHDRTVDAAQDRDLAPPPLWQMAKAKAKRLKKLGVRDSSNVKLQT